uniref:Uncharacterized protein n=1 Tax=Acidianus brierleyi TaxID=41673 RepID=A0A2U9IGH0_9CREN
MLANNILKFEHNIINNLANMNSFGSSSHRLAMLEAKHVEPPTVIFTNNTPKQEDKLYSCKICIKRTKKTIQAKSEHGSKNPHRLAKRSPRSNMRDKITSRSMQKFKGTLSHLLYTMTKLTIF